MLGNASLNLTQPINYFLRPVGLSLSSREQIITKVTTAALAILLVAGSLPSASACSLLTCLQNCPDIGQRGNPECAQKCFSRCFD